MLPSSHHRFTIVSPPFYYRLTIVSPLSRHRLTIVSPSIGDISSHHRLATLAECVGMRSVVLEGFQGKPLQVMVRGLLGTSNVSKGVTKVPTVQACVFIIIYIFVLHVGMGTAGICGGSQCRSCRNGMGSARHGNGRVGVAVGAAYARPSGRVHRLLDFKYGAVWSCAYFASYYGETLAQSLPCLGTGLFLNFAPSIRKRLHTIKARMGSCTKGVIQTDRTTVGRRTPAAKGICGVSLCRFRFWKTAAYTEF